MPPGRQRPQHAVAHAVIHFGDLRPGLIRVRLGEPPPEPKEKPKGLFAWLKRKPESPPDAPPLVRMQGAHYANGEFI